MKAYPVEFRQKVIADAQMFGLLASARFNHVSPQSAVSWCHQQGVFLTRISALKPCAVCGKEFKYNQKLNRVCCSAKCRKIYDHETRSCPVCGNSFTVIKSHSKRYCCHSCYAKAHRKEQHEPKRRGSNWSTIRRRFKDNPVLCEMCKTAMATDLHHIVPFKCFNGDWERANAEQNRIALCQDCHHKAEKFIRKVFAAIKEIEEVNGNKTDSSKRPPRVGTESPEA